MKNLDEIKVILEQVKSFVQEKYNITQLGVFGDYVKGDVGENSKVSILVDYTDPPSLLDIVDMEYYLSDILNTKATIITKNGLKGHRKDRILSEVVYI